MTIIERMVQKFPHLTKKYEIHLFGSQTKGRDVDIAVVANPEDVLLEDWIAVQKWRRCIDVSILTPTAWSSHCTLVEEFNTYQASKETECYKGWYSILNGKLVKYEGLPVIHKKFYERGFIPVPQRLE